MLTFRKRFVIDAEALPLDLRVKLDLIATGAALALDGEYGFASELAFEVAWDEGNPEPQWEGPGLVREEVLT